MSMENRTDTASRIIRASPQAIYRALLDPAAVATWLPPEGMTGRIDAFDPRVGGAYCLTLTYDNPDHVALGKSAEHADAVRGRFVRLVTDKLVAQQVRFDADDPAYAGEMTITWEIAPDALGSKVKVTCTNVPTGISREDHDAGLRSTLANLASFTE